METQNPNGILGTSQLKFKGLSHNFTTVVVACYNLSQTSDHQRQSIYSKVNMVLNIHRNHKAY